MKCLAVIFDLIQVFCLIHTRIFLKGCFVHGLYLEGAGWDRHKGWLIKQKPKQLIQDLPVLKVIPIEAHRLKLQVSVIVISLFIVIQ